MSSDHTSGRLSTLQAAMVIARRDFGAILFSRSFFIFLLGPLFPVIVALAAGSIGQQVDSNIARTTLGVAMSATDSAALIAARQRLEPQLGGQAPDMVMIGGKGASGSADPRALLRQQQGNVAAIVSGSLAKPVLTGAPGLINGWQGPVSLIAAQAQEQAKGRGPSAFPAVALAPVENTNAVERQGRMRTAQSAQTLLFLLTMLLAGMVLSNLVEEKANKIIEVLAAAIPMNAVFYGKLFAMLGVSFVGIAAWGVTFGSLAAAGGHSLNDLVVPAVGWPVFIALGIAYFTMAYLLLGSVFLTIGSMAATVREVQTLSMPASMSQLMVFFFATYATASTSAGLTLTAQLVPFSSPFAMMGKAAQDGVIWPHLAALVWQGLWVALVIHFGSNLFRRRVMKSGPQKVKAVKRKLQPA